MHGIMGKSRMDTIRIILALAWPTILEQIMQTAVQYIDTAMVGALGTQATAAVGATGTINWLISGTIGALGIGFLSFISRACGAGEEKLARQAAGQAVLAVLVVGIGFTLLTCGLSGVIPVWMQVDEHIRQLAGSYFLILYLPMLPRTAMIVFGTLLRSAGDTKTPMKVGIMVNLINIVLNFLFIYPTRTVRVLGKTMVVYGVGWGVLGAAAASAIAFTLGGIRITIALWKHTIVSPKGQSLKLDRRIMNSCLRVALPNMLQRFATAMGYVTFAAMINSLGEVAAAAHTIANTVESAFYIPGYGMQTAAATLAGNAYGARDREGMKRMAAMFIPLEIGFMVLSGGALFACAPNLMEIFSYSGQVIDLGTTVLRMVALSEPFFGFSIIMEGLLMGVGKTRIPFVYNLISMWCIRIVGTFLCTRYLGMGLVSAWGCMIVNNLVLCGMYAVCYKKGAWNPLRDEV